MAYSAIISRNLRHLSPGQPSVLLRDIYASGTLYRDHMWVDLSPIIDRLLRHKCFNNNRSAVITFEAEEKEYLGRLKDVKKTLKSIQNIAIKKIVKKSK